MTRFLIGFLSLSFLFGAAAASADDGSQTYVLSGSDAFRLAGRDLQSITRYTGTERLTFEPAARGTLFRADVSFEKSDGSSTTTGHAAFDLTMAADGSVRDERDADPDYLTILNQPFSIQLDGPTMHDLHDLRSAVPFDSPSPMTGAPLHGTLRRLPDGSFNGVRVLGIAFAAHGPLRGGLPDRPTLSLTGTITMNGTAYYAYNNALLLALDATLLIDGRVTGQPEGADRVEIAYRRSIRTAPRAGRGR